SHRLQRSGGRYRVADVPSLDLRGYIFFGRGAASPQIIPSRSANEDNANRRHDKLLLAKPQFHFYISLRCSYFYFSTAPNIKSNNRSKAQISAPEDAYRFKDTKTARLVTA